MEKFYFVGGGRNCYVETEKAAASIFEKCECNYICVNTIIYPSNYTCNAKQRRENAPIVFRGFNPDSMKSETIYDESKLNRISAETCALILKSGRPATKKELTLLSHSKNPFCSIIRI